MMLIKWMMHMFMLCVCSAEDWKEKKVSLWKIAVYAVFVLLYGIWEAVLSKQRADIWLFQIIMGSVPGVALLILGRVSGESVGYADGLLGAIIGMSMGFWEGMGILMTAFCGIFIEAVYIFVKDRKTKKREIAFVPFLLMGMAGAGLWIGI